MHKIVEDSIINLFTLLNIPKLDNDKEVKTILNSIGEESLKEVYSGVNSDTLKNVTSFQDAMNQIDSSVMQNILEAASSKVLVNYFAEHNKSYTEKQKEIFLTFLLTNKIKRELEKTN